MKKLMVVLMAMALCMAFAMPAAAAELTLGGTWYMQGIYSDNHSVLDKSSTWPTDPSWGSGTNSKADTRNNRGATAYYQHKLTLRPTVKIVEGLSFHMQMEVAEEVMGDNTWKNDTATGGRVGTTQSSRTSTGAAGALVQENIEFEQIFVNFKTGLGQFRAGFMYPDFFGTMFLYQPYTRPRIMYNVATGPMVFGASITKTREWRNRSFYGGAVPATATVPGTVTVPAAAGLASNGIANDSDGDIYRVSGIYKFSKGDAGLEYEYWRDSGAKARVPAGTNGYITTVSRINPYVKFKSGGLYVEAEGFYNFGTLRKYEAWSAGQTVVPDVTLSAWGAYIKGQYTFNPFTVGAKFIYKSGNDMEAADKQTGGIAVLYGDDYGTPAAGTLILWNSDYQDAMGAVVGNAITAPTMRYIDNVWFYQVYAGMNITPKLSVEAKISYATADKKPRLGTGVVSAANPEYVSDKYGLEFDLVGTYKIFDNLSYIAGFGYLNTGDYFKGFSSDAKIKDNYILTHKLSLFF